MEGRRMQESAQPGDGSEDDTRCGLGIFHPTWLQKLASTKMYVILHGAMGLNLFALYSYRVAVLTTLEKRFKIPSKTSGFIVMGLDIGVTCSTIIVGYFGSRSHMPRLIAAGSVITGVACFLAMLPHAIYGPGQDALDLTLEYGDVPGPLNATNGTVALCHNAITSEEDCITESSSTIPVAIFFITELMFGVGDSGQLMLGLTYLDNNSRKDKAPFLLAISACIRMLGPSVGFSIASYALSQYIDPSLHPTIGPEDPRWMGAWWMGWSINGVMAFLLAFFIALFPRQLARAKRRKTQPITHADISFEDFMQTVKKLLRNKVFVLNTTSTVFFVFGFAGYWTFMPKYLETQYGQTAASASLISGSVGLVFTGLGIITAAIVITRFKPSARQLAAWSVFVEIISVIGRFSWTFLSCNSSPLHGNSADDGSWNMTTACNSECLCGQEVKYSPICSADGSTNFFSPCYAGCTAYDFINTSKAYSNCSCIPGGQAIDGVCSVDCGYSFTIFLVSQCIMSFLEASGKSGNTLIHFRCVDEKDKAFSIGVGELFMGILAFIPAPLVYGTLLDWACIAWGRECGERGNCWLYDGQSLRNLMNLTATALLTCGALFDIGVWYYCKGLQMYDEHTESLEQTSDGRGKKKWYRQILSTCL
ncbi:solute carrier organic anion transporter family member 74D isoform X2 [Anabrus simplex]|uniref:solute carrier organic anion transporter family member 74D isoform X2 n=1 Tax=Anabrus simplex TaxID=316456 RepID=UPI0035A31B31